MPRLQSKQLKKVAHLDKKNLRKLKWRQVQSLTKTVKLFGLVLSRNDRTCGVQPCLVTKCCVSHAVNTDVRDSGGPHAFTTLKNFLQIKRKVIPANIQSARQCIYKNVQSSCLYKRTNTFIYSWQALLSLIIALSSTPPEETVILPWMKWVSSANTNSASKVRNLAFDSLLGFYMSKQPTHFNQTSKLNCVYAVRKRPSDRCVHFSSQLCEVHPDCRVSELDLNYALRRFSINEKFHLCMKFGSPSFTKGNLSRM